MLPRFPRFRRRHRRYHATLNRGGGLAVAIGRQAKQLLELGFAHTLDSGERKRKDTRPSLFSTLTLGFAGTLTAVMFGAETGRVGANKTRAAAARGVASWPRDANMAVANARTLADQPPVRLGAAIAEVERSLVLNPR